MRILIPMFSLKSEYRGGFFTFSTSFIKALDKVSKNKEVIIICSSSNRDIFENLNLKYIKIISGLNIPFHPQIVENYFIRHIVKKYNPDIVHFLIFGVPLPKMYPYLITAHDLNFLKFPGLIKKPLNKFYWKNLFIKALLNSYKIIAISQHTKKDLGFFLGIPSDRIETINLGSGFEFFEGKENEEILNKLNIKKEKYLLSVGNLIPRKNFKRMIKAFKKATEYIDKKIKYIIVGEGEQKKDIEELIKNLGLKERVLLTGKLDFESLYTLYKNAIALLYVSLYEGFGIPAVESITVETPVITSDIEPLNEIAKNTGILVNPFDEKDIFSAIVKIVNDVELRETLINNCKKEKRNYSWISAAKKTIRVYDNIFLKLKKENS